MPTPSTCVAAGKGGLDVSGLPEFGFRHSPKPGGLYGLLHQYFLARWEDPRVPEYDLETDELVWQDEAGVTRREPFAAEGERVPELVA